MAWDKIICPKSHSSLGFRDMRLFNLALLAPIDLEAYRPVGWLMCKVNESRVLHERKYRIYGLYWDASAVWRGVKYGLEILKKGIIWCIEDGQTVRCWRVPWIPRVGPHMRISD